MNLESALSDIEGWIDVALWDTEHSVPWTVEELMGKIREALGWLNES